MGDFLRFLKALKVRRCLSLCYKMKSNNEPAEDNPVSQEAQDILENENEVDEEPGEEEEVALEDMTAQERREFDMLNRQLDQLDQVLNQLDSKNDKIHDQLKEL